MYSPQLVFALLCASLHLGEALERLRELLQQIKHTRPSDEFACTSCDLERGDNVCRGPWFQGQTLLFVSLSPLSFSTLALRRCTSSSALTCTRK